MHEGGPQAVERYNAVERYDDSGIVSSESATSNPLMASSYSLVMNATSDRERIAGSLHTLEHQRAPVTSWKIQKSTNHALLLRHRLRQLQCVLACMTTDTRHVTSRVPCQDPTL